MRILHVITRLELGGAQQNTLRTCRDLAAMGHDVVLASGVGGMLDDEAREGPFRWEPVPSLVREIRPVQDARALAALVRLVRRERPDVVHSHSSKAGALARVAARLAGARVVVHSVHGWSFAAGMPWASRALYRIVEHACAPLTTHFVCVAARDLERGRRLGIVAGGRGSVIRSGFDLEEFAPSPRGRERVRAEWGAAADDVLVVNVSNCKPQKAPLDFVEAAAHAAAREPSLRFALVGDGPLRPRVEALVCERGLESRFVVAGWRRDVADVLSACDVFALSSLWEGLPRTVVQARAAGRPVVATAVDGTCEAVEDGVTGCLVPSRDPHAMAEALVRLARDAGLRERMALAGSQGLDEFSARAMVEAQAALYERLVARGRSASSGGR